MKKLQNKKPKTNKAIVKDDELWGGETQSHCKNTSQKTQFFFSRRKQLQRLRT